MPDTAQHLLGQLADGRFRLRKLLGVSTNSAVFLTSVAPDRPSDPDPDAAIKLIPEDPANSEVQLDRWSAAAALSHPGLLRILHYGRCIVDGSRCLYIVTELADENLGQLLPERALTPDETHGMLAPVLETLDFLHEKGLVHAGFKPGNIHAIGDNVKLSSDRILPAGESSSAWPPAAPYAASESIHFPASDIWSLGISLFETLTKHLPKRDASGQFALSELPAPFLEIVRGALVEDATLRISLDSVRSLLDPAFVPRRKHGSLAANSSAAAPDSPEALIAAVQTKIQPPAHISAPANPPHPGGGSASAALVQAAATTASGPAPRTAPREVLPQVDPLSVPLSPVSPTASLSPGPSSAPRTRIPVSSLPHVNATIPGPRRVPSPPIGGRSNKLFLVSAAAAIILAVLFIPRFFLRSSSSPSSTPSRSAANQTTPPLASDSSDKPNSAPPTTSPSATPSTNPPAASPSTKSAQKPSPGSPSSGSVTPPKAPARSAATNPPASTAKNSTAPSSAPATQPSEPAPSRSSSSKSGAALEVTNKVLPVVSEKSRSTIHGTVRINVRVQLNPDGSVASAGLDTPASSQFFANLALKAAEQWRFAPASSPNTPAFNSASPSSSSGMPSSAVVRFDFTQTATSAYLP
jgi:TonB family protein